MEDAGCENFVFWLSRTKENAFLDAFSNSFVPGPHMFFAQQKMKGPWPTRPPPWLHGPCRRLIQRHSRK